MPLILRTKSRRRAASVARPDPRAIAKLLIFRAFFGTSYRSTFSKLHDNVEYRSELNLRQVLCRPTIKTFLSLLSEGHWAHCADDNEPAGKEHC